MQQTSQPTSPPSGEVELSKQEPPALPGNAGMSASSLEELLLNAMDEAVLKFAQIMSDHSVLTVGVGDNRREVMKYSFSEKMKAAEFVRDWVSRRRKIAPPENAQDDAPNISELRKAIREETMATLERERVLRAPPKKAGRPTKEEAAKRKAVAEAATEAIAVQQLLDDAEDGFEDDNELQRALRGN